ncbi:MAG: 3-hydroxybutyryl-CoA dehydrogenase, partial [Thermomicrobiales bacterium]|nr:3-hydroxybutyryl-CoA dehydrogenase [Thermomicrobiales bacterium]
MGHGIAQTFAIAGCRVRGYDDVAAARTSLHDRIRNNLLAFVEAGIFDAEQIEPTLSRITVHESEAEAVHDAQFITEAIREEIVAKQELFARLEPLVSDEAILASNSSTFPISQSGERLRRP